MKFDDVPVNGEILPIRGLESPKYWMRYVPPAKVDAFKAWSRTEGSATYQAWQTRWSYAIIYSKTKPMQRAPVDLPCDVDRACTQYLDDAMVLMSSNHTAVLEKNPSLTVLVLVH